MVVTVVMAVVVVSCQLPAALVPSAEHLALIRPVLAVAAVASAVVLRPMVAVHRIAAAHERLGGEAPVVRVILLITPAKMSKPTCWCV